MGLKIGVFVYHQDLSDLYAHFLKRHGYDVLVPPSWDTSNVHGFIRERGRELDAVISFTKFNSNLSSEMINGWVNREKASVKRITVTTQGTPKGDGGWDFKDSQKRFCDVIVLAPVDLAELGDILLGLFPERQAEYLH